ncbi:cation-translocating P-type ATPase [Nostoc sp.]|uniref:cation-translocating P-type ATPase n=1 Tax=Nostoc sp. TaxID=1180 RepID=UPI002FF4182F
MVSTVDLNTVDGLSEQEAIARLKQDGYNELPSAGSGSILSFAWETVQDPIFLLLFGGGIIYWVLGDLQEALILLGFVFFITGISLYQEGKTEHTLEALRDLSSPRALVIRGGERKRIAGREVVRGDVLVLAEGDSLSETLRERVPADAMVLSCSNFSTDESLLTGESLPVRKVAAAGTVEMARPGGDELPFVYSGTLVVQGQGIAQVQAVGAQTEMGKIGNALQKVKPEPTPLQQEMTRLVSRLFGIALLLCVAIVVIYGITRGDWLKGFLAGITLAMAILPNEFPVVVTIFLALGAWRISQKHVLARRASAVETLGSATVLCVDKTGTLTLNQMAVQQLFAYNHAENPHPYNLVLLPVHVAFLHLIIDPACSIVLEAEPAETTVMQRPPRNPKEPLFGRKTLGLAVLQGVGILAIALVVFVVALYRKQGELDARALTFTTLILANLGLILSESSSSCLSLKILKSPNAALWWVIGGGLAFLAIILYVPFLRQLFSFSFLHPIDLAICLGGGAIALLWFELLKLLNRPQRVIQSKSKKHIQENL